MHIETFRGLFFLVWYMFCILFVYTFVYVLYISLRIGSTDLANRVIPGSKAESTPRNSPTYSEHISPFSRSLPPDI